MMRRSLHSLPIAALAFGAGCAIPPDIVAFSVESSQTADEPDGSQDVPSGTGNDAAGKTDDANKLRDSCGNVVVLRGVNEMADALEHDPTGETWLPEIARTGANAVRLRIGQPGHIIPDLDALLTNCEKANLAAIVTVDAPNTSMVDVDEVAHVWLDAEVLPVLWKHRRHVLIEIVDRLGDDSMSDDEWINRYTTAVHTVHDNGLGEVPVVVKVPDDGTRASTLFGRGGSVLMTADPTHKLVLSIKMRPDPEGTYDAERIASVLQAASKVNFSILIDAFGPKTQGCKADFPYKSVLSNANRYGVGWMAWSWGAAHNESCPDEDMTDDGTLETLHGWGREVVQSDDGTKTAEPNGISTGSCE